MSTILVLLSVKLRLIGAVLFDSRKKYLVRNAAMAFFLSVILALSYMFFYHLIFKYLAAIEDIGFLLINRLVTIGFLIFFFLLIVSSFITSFGSLFKSTETEYLFSTPVSTLGLFTGKFFDILVFSSWTILAMAVPILYAYAKVQQFGTIDYVLAGVAVLVPFVVAAVSLGVLSALIVRFISRYVSVQTLALIAVPIFIGLIYLVVFFAQPTQLVIEFREDFRSLNYFINNFQLTSNPFLPNYWFIQALLALVLRSSGDFMTYTLALAGTALVCISGLYFFVDVCYYRIWLETSEHLETSAERKSTRMISKPKTSFLFTTKNQGQTLLNKDLLIFIREPSQWAQLLLLCALLALYFMNLRFIPKDIEIEQWRTILFIMNFGFCGFVLAALAVRFVFPSLSLEGSSFWVIGSAPLSTSALFKEKFISSFVGFFILAETVGLVSSYLLELEYLYRFLTFAGIFLMSVTLSCLAVGMGALYPDFSERNPSKIVSSPGGILTIVLSLVYLGIMVTTVAVPAYAYTLYLVTGAPFPLQKLLFALVGICIVNLLFIVLPLKWGADSFARREF